MPTLHICRWIPLVPTARLNALKTWWDGRYAAGELPQDNPLLWPELETTGGAAWGRWSNGAYTAPQALVIARRLCTLASVTPPGDLDGRPRKGRKDWINSQKAAIFSAIGIGYHFCDNDAGGPAADESTWPRFDDYIEARGLRRKTVAI